MCQQYSTEGTFNTFLQGRGTCVMAEKPVSPFPNRSFSCKKGKCSKQEYLPTIYLNEEKEYLAKLPKHQEKRQLNTKSLKK